MGIDIGDLSSVMLASLPRTVSNYVQRVGRAGRLTGNALDLAFVQGRGEFLPRLGDPLSLINGAVTPPATYLSAEEILRRQYIAHLADSLARDPDAIHPAPPAPPSRNPPGEEHLPRPARRGLPEARRRRPLPGGVRRRRRPHRHPPPRRRGGAACMGHPGPDGSSGLVATIGRAAQRWHAEQQDLKDRLDQLVGNCPTLRPASRTATTTPARSRRPAPSSACWRPRSAPRTATSGSPRSSGSGCCPTTRWSTTPSSSTSP
ncbi:hypothetical protein G7085_20390 [Tessaracoccus sp. HDW20]|nr:helicase-related protein [Tessaracoccus coleopterorum]NHB86087.1 hypothetical protein [Tessaracoccus coleopterorum]